MEKQYKNIKGEVKELTEAGEGVIVFATLNVIDSDDDVTLPGAFGNQVAPIVPAHDWQHAPIGKASIREEGDKAIADIKLNLETQGGKEWYAALIFDINNPPVKQEYSYGFSILEESRGEFEGRNVRFLKGMKVHEISPVLVGAGVGTTTLALKDKDDKKEKEGLTLEEEIKAAETAIIKLIDRVKGVKDIRDSQNRPLSDERVKELIDIQKLLSDFDMLIKSPYHKEHELLTEFSVIQHKIFDFKKSLL